MEFIVKKVRIDVYDTILTVVVPVGGSIGYSNIDDLISTLEPIFLERDGGKERLEKYKSSLTSSIPIGRHNRLPSVGIVAANLIVVFKYEGLRELTKVLSHEMYHFVRNLCIIRNLEPEDSTEPGAYLQGYLSGEVFDLLQEVGDKLIEQKSRGVL